MFGRFKKSKYEKGVWEVGLAPEVGGYIPIQKKLEKKSTNFLTAP